jgi:hypothetical protein
MDGMDTKLLSRRSLLRGVAALGLTPIVGQLANLFPEAGVVLANRQAPLPTFLQAPRDLIVSNIEGKKASTLLAEALRDGDVVQLRQTLPDFRPELSEARVASATWQRGAHSATVVAVPFTNDDGAHAALFYARTDGTPSSLMVEFPNPSQLTQAIIYSVANGHVTRVDAADRISQLGATTTSCTVNCIINCLPGWGCTGLALSLCAGSLLMCGMLIFPSCIGAVICTFWCGYAFSQCTCRCCGC